jgi:hypothetical protein
LMSSSLLSAHSCFALRLVAIGLEASIDGLPQCSR